MTDPADLILEVVSWVLLTGGGLVCLIGAIGMIRMPDVYTRIHGVSVIDGLGAGMLLVGMALQAGFTLTALKLIIILALILFTIPVAAHALALGALHRGIRPHLGAQDKATRAALARVLGKEPVPDPAPADKPAADGKPEAMAGQAPKENQDRDPG